MAGNNITSRVFLVDEDGTRRPFTFDDYPADHPRRIPVPPGLTPEQHDERNAESARRIMERTRELEEERKRG